MSILSSSKSPAVCQQPLWPHLCFFVCRFDCFDQCSVCLSQKQGDVVSLSKMGSGCCLEPLVDVAVTMVTCVCSSGGTVDMLIKFKEGSL